MLKNSNNSSDSGDISAEKPRTDGNFIDLIGTTVASIIISILLSYYIMHKDQTLILVALLGTVLGWACGLITSPYNAAENKNMGNIAKIASFVIGSYLILKFDKFADSVISSAAKNPEKSSAGAYNIAIHIATAGVMYVTAFIFVYITRSYSAGLSKFLKKIGTFLKYLGEILLRICRSLCEIFR